MSFLVNTLISAVLISLVTWISKKNLQLAGFLGSIPLNTVIVLLLTHLQYGESAKTVGLSKSIFVGVILSLAFFVPFFLMEKLRLNFWMAYGLGFITLFGMYYGHRHLAPLFIGR